MTRLSEAIAVAALPEPVTPGASRTALASLQTQALMEGDDADGLAARLYPVAAVRGREHLDTASDPVAYRAAVRAGTLPGPGHVAQLAARKRWMADAANAAISAGFRQVVVLGAGFDTLGLRLARRNLLVIELDRPATLEAKRIALAAAGIEPPWPRLAAADLGEPTALAALAGMGWKSADRTLFVAELALEYLAPPAARALLATLAAAAAPGSRLACTVRFGDPADDRLAAATAAVGEPMRFRPLVAELPGLLSEAGLGELASRGGVIGRNGATALLVLETRPRLR